jgi:DNA-nicking Smr family endonuclease
MTLVALLAVIGMVVIVVAMILPEMRGARVHAAREIRQAGEVEDAIDLHSFAPRDIPEVVTAYLEAASRAGLREVRVIHGKGKGVQRARVQEVLAASPLVAEFQDAPADRGAWGATLVWLRESTRSD